MSDFVAPNTEYMKGLTKSKRKNDKNVKKYHESFASCKVI